MQNKIEEIKTLKDILNVVNEDNIDVFLKDFSNWLGLRIGIKKANLPEGIEIQEMKPIMNWIDDGKNEANITIKISGK